MDRKPLTLFLIRHGQTAWNLAQRLQGWRKVPLDETGVAQVEKIARRLAREALDAIFASDLDRAQATAHAMAAHHACLIHTDPRLRELSFGEWEGLTYPEIEDRFPSQLQAWEQAPSHLSPPGGETLLQLATRLELVLQDLRASLAAQTVAIAAHGGASPGAHMSGTQSSARNTLAVLAFPWLAFRNRLLSGRSHPEQT